MKLEEEQARLRVMEADLLRHHKQEAAYYAAVKCFQEVSIDLCFVGVWFNGVQVLLSLA